MLETNIHGRDFARLALVFLAAACAPKGPSSDGGETAERPNSDDDDSDASSECRKTETLCDDECVSLKTNASHCGECGHACGSGATCADGSCECQSGFERCEESCVDAASDPAHCGQCGQACAADEVCSLGACSDACAAGLTACGQTCVDLATHTLNCGECDRACPGGRLCVDGACECERAEERECDGTCVDLSSAAAHCGACGNACPAGATCESGQCVLGNDTAAEDTDGENGNTGDEGGVAGDPYLNPAGYIEPGSNPFDIVGEFYAFNDGNSSTQTGNPYRDGKYCIAGALTGASGDWGAGIGFDLNRPLGAERLPYIHDGKVEGFEIALSGHSPGRVRVQFVIDEPQSDNQPFLEAHLNTTMIYPVDWPQIPASWDVPNAGQVIGEGIYSVQIFVEGDEAGPFEVCIDALRPVGPDELEVPARAAPPGYFGARTIDDAILEREYELWKKLRFRDCGDGSACIPRDEGDCISEGVGYGMLVAVGFDDHDAFQKLWTYYSQHRNRVNLMAWRTNACGGDIDSAAATDGDLDVAMALIQAACRWGGNYESDARSVITALRNAAVDQSCGRSVLKPGEGFGGCSRTNPSYFAPGYYKIFAEKTGDATWTSMVDDGYTMLAAQQARHDGLVTDWCDASGNAMGGLNGEEVRYGPDASRTPWRVATDYAWNQDMRAVTFLDNVAGHVERNGGIPRLFTPNSNFRGGVAFSAMHQDPVKAQTFANAWLQTSVDDETYFPGTLRLVYMLLASHRFPKSCM